jgi:hypothetical protein
MLHVQSLTASQQLDKTCAIQDSRSSSTKRFSAMTKAYSTADIFSRTTRQEEGAAGLGRGRPFRSLSCCRSSFFSPHPHAGWLIKTSSPSCDMYEELDTQPHQRCNTAESWEDTIADQNLRFHASRFNPSLSLVIWKI